MTKVVFDIGGTSMRVARVEASELKDMEKVATPQDPKTGFSTLLELIHKVSDNSEVENVVGGMAGIMDTDGTLFHSPNLVKWDKSNLAEFLKKEVCADVRIYNDSALVGLGEAVYGAGKGFSIVGYIGIGTGVGGARIVNQSIDSYTYGFEPGQHIIDMQNNHTFEDVVSGRALSKKYSSTPANLTRETYAELTPSLAKGLYNTTLFWSPEILVVGGSLINDENGFVVSDVVRELQKLNTMYPKLPAIKKSELGDIAGLYGAQVLLENIPTP